MASGFMSSLRSDVRLQILLTAILVVKTVLLLVYGPQYSPDSTGYVAYADEMLGGSSWRHSLDLSAAVMPVGALRMIGYPALIAAAKGLSEKHFDYAIVMLQILISLLASVFIYRLCRVLTRSGWLSFAAVALLATTTALICDLSILSDSLHGSILSIVLAVLATSWLERRTVDKGELLILGGLFAAAFLVREVTLYYLVFFLGLVCGAAAQPKWSLRRIPAALLLFSLPSLVASSAYLAWNQHRSGMAFLTCGNATALMVPMVEVRRGAFTSDSPLAKVSREVLGDHDADKIPEIMRQLHSQYELTITQIAAMTRSELLQAVTTHPVPYMMRAVRRSVWILPRMLVETPRVLRVLHAETSESFGERLQRLRSVGGAWDWALLGVDSVAALISGSLFLLFLAGPPLCAVLRRRQRVPVGIDVGVMMVLWLVFLGVVGMNALVYLEQRYVIGVLPIAMVISLRMLRDLLRHVAAIGEIGHTINDRTQ